MSARELSTRSALTTPVDRAMRCARCAVEVTWPRTCAPPADGMCPACRHEVSGNPLHHPDAPHVVTPSTPVLVDGAEFARVVCRKGCGWFDLVKLPTTESDWAASQRRARAHERRPEVW